MNNYTVSHEKQDANYNCRLIFKILSPTGNSACIDNYQLKCFRPQPVKLRK